MTNADDWYWETGDKFTFKSAREPKKVYEVKAIKGSKYVDFDDPENPRGEPFASIDAIEPWVSPKLRKHITLKAPWAPDPEDELIENIEYLLKEINGEVPTPGKDNENFTSDEITLERQVIKMIANEESRDPVALAKAMAEVNAHEYQRYY